MSALFASIEGQDQVTSFLQHAYDTDGATHAYLICGGAQGEGFDIALRFAAGLVAREDSERYEQALRQVHPDLHVYAPGGAGSYLVEQIREITHDAELAPVRAANKIYIVQDAQRLAGAPANAFLKTLEEPPQNVTCILVASNEAAVLETLRSRCEVLVLNDRQAARALDFELASQLEALARGCSNQELLAGAKRLVENARACAQAQATGDMDAEEYIERYEDYLSQGAKKQIEQQGKREASARERAALLDSLVMMRTWLRDCLAAREGATSVLAYPACASATARVAEQASEAGLIAALDAVRGAAARISYNVTPQLAIEAMFFEIREALCHK